MQRRCSLIATQHVREQAARCKWTTIARFLPTSRREQKNGDGASLVSRRSPLGSRTSMTLPPPKDDSRVVDSIAAAKRCRIIASSRHRAPSTSDDGSGSGGGGDGGGGGGDHGGCRRRLASEASARTRAREWVHETAVAGGAAVVGRRLSFALIHAPRAGRRRDERATRPFQLFSAASSPSPAPQRRLVSCCRVVAKICSAQTIERTRLARFKRIPKSAVFLLGLLFFGATLIVCLRFWLRFRVGTNHAIIAGNVGCFLVNETLPKAFQSTITVCIFSLLKIKVVRLFFVVRSCKMLLLGCASRQSIVVQTGPSDQLAADRSGRRHASRTRCDRRRSTRSAKSHC